MSVLMNTLCLRWRLSAMALKGYSKGADFPFRPPFPMLPDSGGSSDMYPAAFANVHAPVVWFFVRNISVEDHHRARLIELDFSETSPSSPRRNFVVLQIFCVRH